MDSKKLIKELSTKYGQSVLLREYLQHPAIPTGSLAIDVSSGIGGIPVGRYTEIYGAEASGKTSLALSVVKQAIQIGISCVYVDVEGSLNINLVNQVLGEYDHNKLVMVQPNSAEDAFEIADAGIEAGSGLIIFDSIAAISPESELKEEDYGKLQIGLATRLTGQFLRKTHFNILDKEVAFVIINQVRANIGAYHGGYVTPVGYALKHYTSFRLFLSKGQDIEDGDERVGNYVNFVVKKNKMAVPFRQAETNVIYGKGIDFYRDVLKFGSMLGVVKSRGSYFVVDDETIGQGTNKAIETLIGNKDLLDKIIESCYNTAKVTYPPLRPTVGEDDD